MTTNCGICGRALEDNPSSRFTCCPTCHRSTPNGVNNTKEVKMTQKRQKEKTQKLAADGVTPIVHRGAYTLTCSVCGVVKKTNATIFKQKQGKNHTCRECKKKAKEVTK